jgi:hypothetical protein
MCRGRRISVTREKLGRASLQEMGCTVVTMTQVFIDLAKSEPDGDNRSPMPL